MATKKSVAKKTASRPASRKSAVSQSYSNGILDYFKFGESYTSLILGMVVVIIATVLLVAFFKNKGINELNPQKDITATSIAPVDQGTYVVKEGDTLWSIAESELGDGFRWQEIMEANNISEATSIEEGSRLKMPRTTSETSLMTAVEATPTDMPEVSVSPTEVPVQPTSTIAPTQPPYLPGKAAPQETDSTGKISTPTYTVNENDYLWDIAVRAYGDGYKWVEISKANNLDNPDVIHKGNILKLPR